MFVVFRHCSLSGTVNDANLRIISQHDTMLHVSSAVSGSGIAYDLKSVVMKGLVCQNIG